MIDTMEKKKIGLLIPHLAKGGAGRAVGRISILLAQSYDVYLILFTSKQIDFEYSGIIIDLQLESKKENLVKKFWRTKKRIEAVKKVKDTYKLDLVISFLDITNISNILSKSKKCKTIVSVRGSIFSNKADGVTAWIKSKALSRLYKRADRIITVSNLLRWTLINVCKINPEKVVTIYNPFNMQKIEIKASEKLTNNELDFVKGNKIILSAGQLVFQKGFWHLIKAFNLIECPNAKLLICGEGPQRNQLTNLITELGLTERIKLIGFKKNVFKYMKTADIFVLSSITEGFPNVLVEAMVCGTAVIATDCRSGPREILMEEPDITEIARDIEKADYGILVPQMTPAQNWDPNHVEDCEIKLSQAMDMLLKNDLYKAEYSKKAILRASIFTNERCINKYEEVINRTLLNDDTRV